MKKGGCTEQPHDTPMRVAVEAEMAAERASLLTRLEEARENERAAFERVDAADATLTAVVDLHGDTFSEEEAHAWGETQKANRVAWAYHDQITHLNRQLAALDSPGELEYRVSRQGRKDRRREERRRNRGGGRMASEPREEKPVAKSTINTIIKGMEAGKSGREIADELNTAQVESPGRGGRWNGQKVRAVFAAETGTKDIRSYRASKRGTAKRSTAKRDGAKRGSAKRETAKRAAGKRTQATGKRAQAKRATAKRASSKRGSSKRQSAKRGNGERPAEPDQATPEAEPPAEPDTATPEAELPPELPPVEPPPPRDVTPLSKEAQASGTSRGGAGSGRKREGKRRGTRRGA